MLLFLTIAFVLLVLALLVEAKPRRKTTKKVFMIVSFLILLLVSGFRGLGVGSDTVMYVHVFEMTQKYTNAFLSYADRFEIGYRFYNQLLAKCFQDPHVLLLLSAFITLLLFYVYAYKTSKKPHLSVILFLLLMMYTNSMCLLRQYLAIPVCCIALYYLSRKKYLLFTVLVLLAYTFHSSAIIMLVLLPLSRIRITRNNRYVILVGIVLAYFASQQIINLFLRFVPQYAKYLVSEYYLANKLGSTLRALAWGMMFLFNNYVYFRREPWILADEERNWYRIEYYCSLIAFVIGLFAIQGAMLERMGLYFSINNCVMIPNALASIKTTSKRRIFTLIIFGLCAIYYIVILALRPYWSGVIPYVFWQ